MAGWKDAIDKYFIQRNMSGMVDKYQLKMQPIVTQLSTVVSEKRDAAISQAAQVIEMLKSLGVSDNDQYKNALVEVLNEEFPEITSSIMAWDINTTEEGEMDEF